MTIVNNLSSWLGKLRTDKQRRVSIRELEKETGVSRSTLTHYLNNKAKRVRLSDCVAIIDYFHMQGYYYTMADLFTLKEDEEKQG